MKKCPFCAEDIQDAAIFCKHCRQDLVPNDSPSAAVQEERSSNGVEATGESSSYKGIGWGVAGLGFLYLLLGPVNALYLGGAGIGLGLALVTRMTALRVLALVFAAFCALALIGTYQPADELARPPRSRTSAPSTPQPSPARPTSSVVVSMAEYSRIQTGMTYAQVVGVIGQSGEELSRNQIVGITTVMYQWMNPDGSNMNAMFQDDALVQKAQFGLS